MKVKNWKLLERVKVGTMSLKNRMVMAPMEARLNRPDGSVNQATIDFYEEVARGGIGMIVVQNSYIDEKSSRSALMHLGVYSDHLIAGLGDLAETIKLFGVGVLLQISHGGRQAHPAANPFESVAPSAIPCKFVKEPVRELTLDEIEEIQNSYVEAARRVKMAGFDGVELHGAHGYLIDEFLSPYTNHRTDKYGGSFGGRALFALEIIEKIRKRVGDDFTLGYRMSADEFVPGGLTINETSVFAKMLQDAHVDYIHVSTGLYESAHHTIPPIYMKDGYSVDLADRIKKAVDVPVITVGSHTIETGEKALREEKADLVAFGRALVADPDLPNKLASGRIEDIRPCIRNNEGCYSRFLLGKTIRCEVNPACGRQGRFKITPATVKKNVVVIGGGIAGMEAARVAALRGHTVTLFEKADRLGGHLVEASAPEFKGPLRGLLTWATTKLEKGGVKIQLKTEVTPNLLEELLPEIIITAVGSDYIVPAVRGVDYPFVVRADDVLLGRKAVGEQVVVMGGGLIGCETALYIAEVLKKKVTVVEMLDEVLNEVEPLSKAALLERLQEAHVMIRTGWHLEQITNIGVICTDRNWQRKELQASTVVLALGLKARKHDADRFEGAAPEVYRVGDCVEPRNIYHAFEDAWRIPIQFM